MRTESTTGAAGVRSFSPQRLPDDGLQIRHLSDGVAVGQLVSGADAADFLVQLLLDVWILGQLVQRPGDGVGGLEEKTAAGSPKLG